MRKARIIGRVSGDGPAMVQSRRPDGRWDVPNLIVLLQPWREAGGPIRNEKLGIRRRTRVPYELWHLLMPKGRVVALTVELDEEERHARLRGWFGWRRDRALKGAWSEWVGEQRLSDKRFGAFDYDARIDQFEARTSWCGREVKLSVPGREAEEALAIAHRLFDSAGDWNRRIGEAVVREMLPLFNENWRDEGEAEIDGKGLLARIGLDSIAVAGPELVNFYFEDGGLFASHWIDVAIWLEEDEIDVNLAG